MAYAAKLAAGKMRLEDCPRLGDEDCAEQLSCLQDMGL
jgi:CO dehydrogenase/acetyl-CoA synthase gamma subunit (corrinoid Fe-S protein)